VGEAVLARPVAVWMQSRFGMDAVVADYASTALVVVAITYFSIVLGELVPKRIGQMSPDSIAPVIARPLKWLSIAATPFVKLLSGSTHAVIALLRLKKPDDAQMVEEEIHSLLLEGRTAGVIEKSESEMVRNVFRLDDRQLGSLMVPRGDLVCLDVTRPWSENARIIETHDHTRFPVVRGGLHDVVGVVSSRVLLARTLKGEVPDLVKLAYAPVFVPEMLTGMELLENFRASGGQHVALVVDEYGEVQGMVTMTDLVEAITGEFKPRRAEDAWAIQREDGSWLLDGTIPLPELKDRLHLRELPEEDRGSYQALSGMLLLMLGRVPRAGDHVSWEGWRFEVVDMDGRRIDKVLATQEAKIGV
ncbi:MAG TPA: hemolysin family protein, partial [Usitatibacter sp.]|nr:hemolysin family protein [Usitatibacter sp.]